MQALSGVSLSCRRRSWDAVTCVELTVDTFVALTFGEACFLYFYEDAGGGNEEYELAIVKRDADMCVFEWTVVSSSSSCAGITYGANLSVGTAWVRARGPLTWSSTVVCDVDS